MADENWKSKNEREETSTGPSLYQPLPDKSCIRLLEVLPSPAGSIICTIKIVYLDEDLIFDALSYTWGNSITLYEHIDEKLHSSDYDEFLQALESSGTINRTESQIADLDIDALNYLSKHPVPYEEVDWNAGETHSIICDGHVVEVAENLFEVLCFFRRLVVKKFALPPEEIMRDFAKPRSRYVWIDALCIDQKNLLERNAQVLLMGQIYYAQNVFGWLGKADTFSGHGIRTLHCIAEKIYANPSLRTCFYGTLYDLGEEISEREWVCVFALLQRLWFRRAWIVQETVFTPALTMICGPNIFKWSVFRYVLDFMSQTGLDGLVCEVVRNLIGKQSISKDLRTRQ